MTFLPTLRVVVLLGLLVLGHISCVTVNVVGRDRRPVVIETDPEMVRRAVADLRALGVAVESYAVDMAFSPVVEGVPDMRVGGYGFVPMTRLRRLLINYIRGQPVHDPWNSDYMYASDGRQYAIVSLGADGIVTDRAQLLAAIDVDARSVSRPICYEAELVFANGLLMAWPANGARHCLPP